MDSSSTDHTGTTSGFGSHQPPAPETPHLCSGGCSFFGTAENKGLCSKCYALYLRDLIKAKSEAPPLNDIVKDLEIDTFKSTKLIISDDQSHNNNSKNNRCGLCNKKVGLLGFECRCGYTFCGQHRYPETHPCNFDFKKAGKISIHNQNPICKSDKIRDRL